MLLVGQSAPIQSQQGSRVEHGMRMYRFMHLPEYRVGGGTIATTEWLILLDGTRAAFGISSLINGEQHQKLSTPSFMD